MLSPGTDSRFVQQDGYISSDVVSSCSTRIPQDEQICCSVAIYTELQRLHLYSDESMGSELLSLNRTF